MKKIVLGLGLILSAMAWAVSGNMGGGDGSWDNPYLIQDFSDFQEFCGHSNYWHYSTRLECDLDLSVAGTYNRAPIAGDISNSAGFQGTAFNGSFDGNKHVIRNLTIEGNSHNDYIGLFGFIGNSGDIVDLGVEEVNIIDVDSYAGGLCGINSGSIWNCYSTGTVTGGMYIGGLCGKSVEGSIRYSYSTGEVNGAVKVGGLCGNNDSSIIGDCYSAGTVTGGAYVGGLCGYNTASLILNSYSIDTVRGDVGVGGLCGYNVGYSTIRKSYSARTVTGDAHVGGLCGLNSSNIIDSYATGAVAGNTNVGGLCGTNPGDVLNSYSAGTVTGETNVGGLVGRMDEEWNGSVSNSFWDIDTSGIIISDGQDGKSTAQMQMQSTFVDAGWDFLGTYPSSPDWMMLREAEDYPRLAWQEVFSGDIAGLYGVDMVDFSYLSNYWGLNDCNGEDDCGRADIDNSGDVGLGDLAAVVEDWLR